MKKKVELPRDVKGWASLIFETSFSLGWLEDVLDKFKTQIIEDHEKEKTDGLEQIT